jgi:IS5 family transposase
LQERRQAQANEILGWQKKGVDQMETMIAVLWEIRYWLLERKRRKVREINWSKYFAKGGQW